VRDHRRRAPRKPLPAIAGLAGGYVVQAKFVVAGVGALLAQSQSAMQALTYLGAAYLLWLGVRVARDPAPFAAENTGAVSALRGVATSGLNPKVCCCSSPSCRSSWLACRRGPRRCTSGARHVHIAACALVYFWVAIAARRLLQSRARAALIIGMHPASP
jgi:threonine/homoserine/homoserine lactone efflux protein